MPEGPLGEFTGYYGRERSPQPVIEVKAVHHRKSPILTAALMAKYPSCEIGAYYAIMRSARILDDLERIGVPGVVAPMRIRPRRRAGAWWSCRCSSNMPATPRRCWRSTAQCPAAAYYTKWIIAVDDDVDPTDFNEVHVGAVDALPSGRGHRHPAQHLVDRARSEPVPPEGRPYGSKVLINACKPHRFSSSFRNRRCCAKHVQARRGALDGTWL